LFQGLKVSVTTHPFPSPAHLHPSTPPSLLHSPFHFPLPSQILYPLPSLPHIPPFPSHPKSFPSRPLNSARGSGKRCEILQQGLAEPKLKSNLVHFSHKIWHQVTTILVTFVGKCLPYMVLLIQ